MTVTEAKSYTASVTTIPSQHIDDAHSLSADAEIDLFELTPAIGTGRIYFKADDTANWQGNIYNGVPLTFSGDSKSTQGATSQPRLVIGEENVDLSAFKPLVFDGSLDGAMIIRTHMLLDDLIHDRLIRSVHYYRVRRVESYSRTKISLQLATWSGSMGFSMPFRQYLPPDYPAVSY